MLLGPVDVDGVVDAQVLARPVADVAHVDRSERVVATQRAGQRERHRIGIEQHRDLRQALVGRDRHAHVLGAPPRHETERRLRAAHALLDLLRPVFAEDAKRDRRATEQHAGQVPRHAGRLPPIGLAEHVQRCHARGKVVDPSHERGDVGRQVESRRRTAARVEVDHAVVAVELEHLARVEIAVREYQRLVGQLAPRGGAAALRDAAAAAARSTPAAARMRSPTRVGARAA